MDSPSAEKNYESMKASLLGAVSPCAHLLIFSLQVVELRKALKAKGASQTGRKSVLIQRLRLLEQPPARSPKRARDEDVLVVEVEEEEQEHEHEHEEEEDATQPEPQQAAIPWSPQLARKPSAPAPGPRDLFSPPLAPARRASSGSPKRALFAEANNSSLSNIDPALCVTPKRSPKKGRVSFGSVEMRKFKMSHGGSTSTPSSGGYPIGLSWEVKGEEVRPLAEKDHDGAPTNASPRRLNERQRKLLLEKVDHRSFFEKQASFETEKEELRQLRRARMSVGCNCTHDNSCGTSRCVCYKEGLACNDDSCSCSCDNCINPNRYNFDQERIDSYRRARIMEAPYVNKFANENELVL